MEEEIMRIDLQIEGYQKIHSIPIELGGVRSFLIDFKEDEDETANDSILKSEEESKKKQKKKE